MSREKRAQAISASTEQRERAFDSADRGRDVVSPYLDSREALIYLRLKTLSALYKHIQRNRLPVTRCGGVYRFDTRELDVWMRRHREGATGVPTITAMKRLGLVQKVS